MGSNSSQIAQSITKSISENIVSSIQVASANNNFIQEINATCTNAQDIVECKNKCSDNSVKHDWSPEQSIEYVKVCSGLCGCSINNVNFKQFITVSSSIQQNSIIDQKIKDSIKNSLEQYTTGDTEQDAKIATDKLSSNSTNIYAAISSNTSSTQKIIVDNTPIMGISFEQSIDIVQNFIQTNTTVQTNINNIANTISQKSISTFTTLLYVGIVLLFIFIVIFGILMLSKSRDLRDFLYRITPILVWFILVAIITVVHILIKPSYVSYIMPEDKTKTKHLDVPKLLMFLFLYYVGTGILMFVFFKFTRRNNSNYSGNGSVSNYSDNGASSSNNIDDFPIDL